MLPALKNTDTSIPILPPPLQSLRLELREGCELPPAAAHAVGAMTHLSSLAIIGGILVPDAVHALLHGISSSPSLTSLTLLPAPRNGLSDFEMPLLAAATAPLQVLQFRAVRLTSAGLQVLSRVSV